ncbi:MAG: prolyl oligopeptidase family serine peptidase, partial [Armatimonadota bacterium]
QNYWGPDETLAAEQIDLGFAALEQLKAGQLAGEGEKGLVERAYENETDGTAQPYHVWVPQSYDPERPTPLVVFLHGYVPYTTINDPWVPLATDIAAAERLGFLFLVPYGRRNSDFVAAGDVDVLAAMREAHAFYNVDQERIYLMGVSMGGYGAWNIGLRYPHLFAALGPVSGHTDMARWLGRSRAAMPFWKRWHYEWDNPIDLAENAANMPLHLMHGALDLTIPTDQSDFMVARLRTLGYPIDYTRVPGEGHFVYFGPRVYDATMDWFADKRRVQWPKQVVYKTYSLRYDTAYWVTIEQLEQWGDPAFMDVRAVEDNRIIVRTKNVAALTLRLGEELVDLGAPVTIVHERRDVFSGDVPASGEVTLYLDEEYEAERKEGLWKKKALCGPIEDAYNYPFLIVRGTSGGPAARAAAIAKADRFADEWDKYADGVPRVKDDTKVTRQDLARYNLVCFGSPARNVVVRRAAGKLPIKFQNGAFVVGDRSFSGDDVGLVMIYPNPFSPDRYIVVQSGAFYGDAVSINHKHDLLPDFIVFDGVIQADQTNRALCAGFFDRQWRLNDRLTWHREGARADGH